MPSTSVRKTTPQTIDRARVDAAAARGRVLNITAATSTWREVARVNGVSRTEQSAFAESGAKSIAGLSSAFD